MARPIDLPSFRLLGERIAYWRERRGMERPELAKLAKIPYSTLSGLEDGDQKSSTKIPQIAAALRINSHYLATDKGDPEDLKAQPPVEHSIEWPFPFDRSELLELDPIEQELAGFKLQRIIEEIKAKRPRHKARKAS